MDNEKHIVDDRLFSKEYICPLCEKPFHSLKPRLTKLQVLDRDADFLVNYKDFNPLLYHILVCPECGFSCTEKHVGELRPVQKKLLQEYLSGRWIHQEFAGVRSLEDAIISYKLAIAVYEIIKFSSFELGMLALHLAWLYRFSKNREQELRFLNASKSKLMDAYAKEDYGDSENFNEGKLCYLIGELSRRTGDKKNAVLYMQKALNHTDISSDKMMADLVRDQWMLIKEM